MHRHIGMPQESMCGIFPEVLSVAAIPIINKSEVLYEKSWFSMFYIVLCFMDHLGAEFISKIFKNHKSSVTSRQQRPEEP